MSKRSTERQLFEMAEAFRRNVGRLTADADLLLAHDRFSSATATAIMALEQAAEMGHQLAMAENAEIMRELPRALAKSNLRSIHARRLFQGLGQGFGDEPSEEEFRACLFMADVMERIREGAIYVDGSAGAWSEPDSSRQRVMAQKMVACARRAARGLDTYDTAMLRAAFRPLALYCLKLLRMHEAQRKDSSQSKRRGRPAN